MQNWVIDWCNLIGVTDEKAIEIAVGITAGGSLLFLGSIALNFIVTLIVHRNR